MDKYRKAVVEMCAAVELAEENAKDGKIATNSPDWLVMRRHVHELKASFNLNLQYEHEQLLRRERERRRLPKEAAA